MIAFRSNVIDFALKRDGDRVNDAPPWASERCKRVEGMKHFRNVCVGVCLLAASVYYGEIPGFILGALGIALIIHSGNSLK